MTDASTADALKHSPAAPRPIERCSDARIDGLSITERQSALARRTSGRALRWPDGRRSARPRSAAAQGQTARSPGVSCAVPGDALTAFWPSRRRAGRPGSGRFRFATGEGDRLTPTAGRPGSADPTPPPRSGMVATRSRLRPGRRGGLLTAVTGAATRPPLRPARKQGMATIAAPPRRRETLESAVIRFAGDSGDGMQLTGTQFTNTSALLGNDLAHVPRLPGRDPRPRRHARRRLRLPDPLRRPRHLHARRRARRAGGDEPGGAQGQPRATSSRAASLIVNTDELQRDAT